MMGSDDSRTSAPTQRFDNDPRLSSQRFDSFSNFAESDGVRDSAVDDSPIFTSQPIPDTPSRQPMCVSGGGFLPDPVEFFSFLPSEENTKAFGGGYMAVGGPILPPPAEMEMEPDEGFALSEWRRRNAIQLEENEKRERRKVNCKTNKDNNREKEKLFLASQEKFHADADKNYWKAIAELVPDEVPVIEKEERKERSAEEAIDYCGTRPKAWETKGSIKDVTDAHKAQAQCTSAPEAFTTTSSVAHQGC